jgi:hypothetical protein
VALLEVNVTCDCAVPPATADSATDVVLAWKLALPPVPPPPPLEPLLKATAIVAVSEGFPTSVNVTVAVQAEAPWLAHERIVATIVTVVGVVPEGVTDMLNPAEALLTEVVKLIAEDPVLVTLTPDGELPFSVTVVAPLPFTSSCA